MAAWLPFAAYHSGDLSPIAYVDNPLAFAGSADRGAAAAEILWRYAALLLVPWPLLPDRSFASTPATALAGPVAALGWLAVVGIVLAGRRRRPLLAWAVLWFALAFLPTSNLLFPTGTIMAERLLFLPSVGPLVWLACTLGCLGRKTAGRPVPRVLFASFLLAAGTAFSVAYLDRAEAWRDSATFHARAVAAAPRSAKAHYDAGLYYQREADWSSAEAEFRRALAIVPRFAAAVGQLAEGLARERNPLEGLAVYETYLAVEPSDEAALANAIRLGLVSGRSRRVLPLAKRLTELAPENGEYKALLDYVEGFRTGARRQFSP
jgi:Tfp pilus assembly protein PilF